MSDLSPSLIFKQNLSRIHSDNWRSLAVNIRVKKVTALKGVLQAYRQVHEFYNWFQALEAHTDSVEYMELRIALHRAYSELIEVVEGLLKSERSPEFLHLAHALYSSLKDKLSALASLEPDVIY